MIDIWDLDEAIAEQQETQQELFDLLPPVAKNIFDKNKHAIIRYEGLLFILGDMGYLYIVWQQ
jgi:hypothetical protein